MFFGAIIHQLYCVSPSHAHFGDYRSQLREATVTELQSRLDFYVDYLAVSAEEVIKDCVPVGTKIDRFLEVLSSNGFWGGEEALAAICNIHQVAITVHQKNGTIEFTPTISNLRSWPALNIFYRSIPGFVEKTHYNSVVVIRQLTRDTLLREHPTTAEVPLRSEAITVNAISFDNHADSLFIAVYHQ